MQVDLREEAKMERYKRMFPGLRPSRASRCLRVVAGKKCLRYSPGGPCVCEELVPWVLDHARMWVTPTGGHVLTAEPYRSDGQDLKRLLEECEKLGLGVDILGESAYYPGRTYLLIIHRGGAE